MRAFVVDTFTRTPFRGSPAGVVLLDRRVDETWMQAVAAELNHPGTAFVDPVDEGARAAGIRWFSPATELSLCGHATLAVAHVLGGEHTFQTGDGLLLPCRVADDNAVSMRFPADPVRPQPPSAALSAGLPGVTVRSVCRGRTDVLVEAASAAEVRGLFPDLDALSKVDARAVIVTAAGDGHADIVSRVFAPHAGIGEDPVTGSAHCTLAGFWSERLGRPELLAEQASERGGLMRTRLDGARVILTGYAVTVWTGELHV
ncbi:MAG TPA: PhzF family phenazine biosynthesis protein [Mycobacterium sp.]